VTASLYKFIIIIIIIIIAINCRKRLNFNSGTTVQCEFPLSWAFEILLLTYLLTWWVWISAEEDMFSLPDDDADEDDIFTRQSGLFTSRTSNLFATDDQVILHNKTLC